MSEVFRSFRRTPYQTTAAFSVLFFTLLLSGLLFISLSFLQGLLGYVETRPRVIVYFQPKAEETAIFAVRDELLATGKVTEVKYVSKQEAYDIYKEYTKNDPLLLEMTSADILPASLEIDAKKPEYLPELANFLSNKAGVDEVQFQKKIVDSLLTLTSTIRRTMLIFFGYLVFMSIIVLTTTTSFKIALKKDEIEILKLLGASNYYIRKPFLKESITLGLIATIFANIVIIGFIYSISTFLKAYLIGIPSLSYSLLNISIAVWPFNWLFFCLNFVITAIFSMIIATIATLASTNKYLD